MKKEGNIGSRLPTLPGVQPPGISLLSKVKGTAHKKAIAPGKGVGQFNNKVPPIGPLGSARKAQAIVAPLPPGFATALAARSRGVSARKKGTGSVFSLCAKGAPAPLSANRPVLVDVGYCAQMNQAPPLSTAVDGKLDSFASVHNAFPMPLTVVSL